MTGADLLCDVLLANGIDVCFANPGTSEMHFVAALDRKPHMRCVLGLFEGVVTAAADGYARMAGKPAATLLHLGPGLANGLANLHNARRAHTPMINIVGDHASYHLAYDAPLTSDIDSLARPMSGWVRRIAGADTIAADAGAAYRAACTMPGVATLILPADATWSEAPAGKLAPTRLPTPPLAAPDAIQRAADVLRGRGRTALVLSGGALRADALALAGRIAAATGARLLAQTSNGRIERGAGRVPVDRIPYPVDLAVRVLAEFDALILIGAAEPVAFFAYPGKPSRLARPDCEVQALATPADDLKGTLAALAEALGAPAGGTVTSDVVPPPEPAAGALTGEAIAAILARRLPENAIVCDEAVTSATQFFGWSHNAAPHDYLQLTGGAIGIGIPLAAGAAVACPGRKVVGLQADGSALYTVQGLWTQARENLDVTTIVFSNRAYAILQGEMRAVGVNDFGPNARRMLQFDEPPIDWAGLGRSLGIGAARAETVEQFAAVLDGALRQRGPFLIEAVI